MTTPARSSAQNIEEEIQTLFVKKKWTLTLAESCTGGAIAAKLTKVPGASDYFLGSLVTYSNAFKQEWLNVPPTTLAACGAVSKEVVEAMVQGLLQKTGSDFGIAVSGIAGPAGATPSKPVGTVWIAIGHKGSVPQTHLLAAQGTREEVIETAVNAALKWLLSCALEVRK